MDRTPMQCIAAKSLLGLGCSHHGFVVKEGGRFKSMQTRYFILYEGCLYYYKDFKSTREQGSICMAFYEAKEDLQQDDVYGIKLEAKQPGKKSYYFILSTNEERKLWMEKLSQEMERNAGDGSEQYDYCYERRNTAPLCEEPNTYEQTDEIEPMVSPRSADPRTRTIAFGPMPSIPPPPVPSRIADAPKVKCGTPRGTNLFMPPKQNINPVGLPKDAGATTATRLAPQPFGKPLLPTAGRGGAKDMPPLPNPNSKPVLPKNAVTFSDQDYAKQKAGMDELAKIMKKKRENYEVQLLKKNNNEDSGTDSDDSEAYLDLDGESSDPMKVRGDPVGATQKTLSTSDDKKVLPLSVYQDSLTRSTAECLLKGIKKPGMYLLRKGRTGLQVLTIYTEEGCKHYQIFENSGSVFLHEGEPQFKTVTNLVHHYYKNFLPTCNFKLQIPYS